MSLVESIKASLSDYEIRDEKYGISFKKIIAERKAFLSNKKLEYSGKVKIDDEKREVIFSDMLKESGSGLSMGSDSEMSSGFGFSSGTYSVGMNGRSGNIQEQNTLFGKKYEYTFNYEDVRKIIEEISKKEGYTVKYSIF